MKSLKEFKSTQKINFHGTVLADDFEDKLIKVFKRPLEKEYLISFKDTIFIELAVLMNCLSFIRYGQVSFKHGELIKDDKYVVFFQLPDSQKVRDFLIVWRFPESVSLLSKRDFKSIIISEDQHLLKKDQTTYKGHGDSLDMLEWDADWQPYFKTRRNFFEFCCYSKNQTQGIDKFNKTFFNIPREISQEWDQDELLKTVLENYLRPFFVYDRATDTTTQSDDIARVVMFESLSNAIRHPNAEHVVLASKFHRKKEDQTKKYSRFIANSYRLVLWDDGINIAHTIKSLVDNDKPVKKDPGKHAFLNDRILVELRKVEFDKTTKTVTTSSSPKREVIHVLQNPPKGNITEARALLFSLLPGITQTLARAIPDVPQYDLTREKDCGLGLYALLRNVVYVHSGKLFIRSGRFRLHIEIAKRTDWYNKKINFHCKMTEYPDYMPFIGNLIIIQIPLCDSDQ